MDPHSWSREERAKASQKPHSACCRILQEKVYVYNTLSGSNPNIMTDMILSTIEEVFLRLYGRLNDFGWTASGAVLHPVNESIEVTSGPSTRKAAAALSRRRGGLRSPRPFVSPQSLPLPPLHLPAVSGWGSPHSADLVNTAHRSLFALHVIGVCHWLFNALPRL